MPAVFSKPIETSKLIKMEKKLEDLLAELNSAMGPAQKLFESREYGAAINSYKKMNITTREVQSLRAAINIATERQEDEYEIGLGRHMIKVMACSHHIIAKCMIAIYNDGADKGALSPEQKAGLDQQICQHLLDSRTLAPGDWAPYGLQLKFWHGIKAHTKSSALLWGLLDQKDNANMREHVVEGLLFLDKSECIDLSNDELQMIFDGVKPRMHDILFEKAEYMRDIMSTDDILDIYKEIIKLANEESNKGKTPKDRYNICKEAVIKSHYHICLLMQSSKKYYKAAPREHYQLCLQAYKKAHRGGVPISSYLELNLAALAETYYPEYFEITQYKALADSMYVPGMIQYGRCLLHGKYVDKDAAEGIKQLVAACDLWKARDKRLIDKEALIHAFIYLGDYYSRSDDDIDKSIKYYQQSYEISGYPDVGKALAIKLFEKEDYVNAFELFNNISEKDVVALEHIAYMSLQGCGTERNVLQAIEHFKVAIEKKSLYSICMLLTIVEDIKSESEQLALLKDIEKSIRDAFMLKNSLTKKMTVDELADLDNYVDTIEKMIAALLQHEAEGAQAPSLDVTSMASVKLPAKPLERPKRVMAEVDDVPTQISELILAHKKREVVGNATCGTFRESVKSICDLFQKIDSVGNALALNIIELFKDCPMEDRIYHKAMYCLHIFNCLKYLRISPDHKTLTPVISTVSEQLLALKGACKLPISTVIFLINAITKFMPCKNAALLEALSFLITISLEHPQKTVENGRACLLLHSLAVIHCVKPELCPPTELSKFTELCAKKTDSLDDPREKSQLYSALFHFNGVFPSGDKFESEERSSAFQVKIAGIIQKQYASHIPKEEELIGILPVDIVLSKAKLAIQVNGPHHYIFDGENYISTSNDVFRNQAIEKNGYRVIEFPFFNKPKDAGMLKWVTDTINPFLASGHSNP